MSSYVESTNKYLEEVDGYWKPYYGDSEPDEEYDEKKEEIKHNKNMIKLELRKKKTMKKYKLTKSKLLKGFLYKFKNRHKVIKETK